MEDLLSYDQNGQSQLLTCLIGCLDIENTDDIDIKPFELISKLYFDSNIKIALKREHFTNVLEVVFVMLTEKASIQPMLPELVELLAEQKGTDEEAKTAGLR